MPFVMAELATSITEAIKGDDRVLSVRDFKMKRTRIDALYVEFTVSSTEGEERIGLEVPV
jgi:hypothetical protein